MLGKWIIKMIWQMERSMAESYTPSGTSEVNATHGRATRDKVYPFGHA